MASLENNRLRALKIYVDKADKSVPMLLDYHIDDFLRELLSLPGRPFGQPPYSGWLVSAEPTTEAPSKISAKGLSLIKRWEGCRYTAYQCPAKVWTIGYGHTKTCQPGMKITPAEAERLLRADLAGFESAVSKLVTVPLSQHQFDALVSFAFNVGTGALANSTLLSLLNRKNYLAAAEEFKRWTKAGNVTLKGLVDRREEEYDLFMS
jgi:lysozyme